MSKSDPQAKTHRFKFGRLFWILGPVVLLGLVLLAYRPLQYHFAHVVTDDAYVSGSLVTVAPSVPGRLSLLAVEEGDTVTQGQLVGRLKEDAYRAGVNRTQAAVSRAKSRLAETQIALEQERQRTGPLAMQGKADLVASRARFSGAEAALKQSESELQRILHLSKSGLISKADLDAARTSLHTRQAELEAVQEGVNRAKAAQELTNSDHAAVQIQQQRVETARAELRLAESELAAADIRLKSTHLYSPVRGIVARVASHPGELLEEGQAICLIRDIDTLWVVANVEETEIRKIRRGQPVEISVDAYPGRTFTGRVLEICSVTSSQFALIPRERMGSNFVKIIQRIPVCISISDPENLLRLGLSTVVSIDIQFPEQSRVP